MILPDVLTPGLTLVFCGTAASAASARANAYYANPTNYFWRALHQAAFTPRQFDPAEFRQLLALGIGLTDLCKSGVGNDSDIDFARQDALDMRDKLLRYRPQIAAFTSKTAWRVFSGAPASRQIAYGWQTAQVGETRCFVLPSPSGSARRYWRLEPWQALAREYERLINEAPNDTKSVGAFR